ncbi:unnamed protein product [Brassica rapa]|uniref:At2g35280-like TPR domain-containing protein n=1 Tax=Brassica campestris TaxID=3711 RepID=A0A8D9CZ63_BRACM|nr:unnamed protein product [Brassica rapa]
MGLCLEHNNPEAHYIEGVNQFFFRKRRVKGLRHLCRSAKGKYDKGTYLCAILMLCTGKIKEGKRVLDTLDWEHTLSTSERSWRKIKKLLVFIVLIQRTRTYTIWPDSNPLEAATFKTIIIYARIATTF